MELPQPNTDIVAHGADIIAALRALVPGGVVGDAAGLAAFDGDALTAYRQKPLACVLPRSKDEVSAVLEFAAAHNIPIVPRGAGTSLSGGALPRADGILLSLTRMNRILEIDLENRCVVTEPGVTNLAITRAVEGAGFLLRARPVQPDRLHHRRQCRGKFRRAALPEIRPDDEQSSGCRDRACRAANASRLAAKAPGARRLDLLGMSPVPKGCSASSSRRRCGFCPSRR